MISCRVNDHITMGSKGRSASLRAPEPERQASIERKA